MHHLVLGKEGGKKKGRETVRGKNKFSLFGMEGKLWEGGKWWDPLHQFFLKGGPTSS